MNRIPSASLEICIFSRSLLLCAPFFRFVLRRPGQGLHPPVPDIYCFRLASASQFPIALVTLGLREEDSNPQLALAINCFQSWAFLFCLVFFNCPVCPVTNGKAVLGVSWLLWAAGRRPAYPFAA